jgi:gas vesicle protein
MTNNGKVFLGIVSAAAVGAIIGMMFAPEKGDEVRRQVKKKANTWAEDLLDAIQKGKTQAANLQENYEDAKDNVKGKFNEMKGEAKAKVENWGDQAKEEADKTRRTV